MPGRSDSQTDHFVRLLALIAVVGLTGRLVYLVATRHWEILGDGFAYHIEAERLADDHIIQGPLHPPVWTFIAAIPPALGLRAVEYQQILGALIGTATVVVTGLAGRMAFTPRIGLVAAALAALYPNMWLYEREVLSEPLAMLAVATCILLVYWFRKAPSAGRAAILGVQGGLMALIRSELIVIFAIVLVPLVLGRSQFSWRTRVGWLALAGVSGALLIAPWSAYNASRFERPILLSSGLGPAMLTGNCPPSYTGDNIGYYNFGCIVFAIDVLSTDPSVSDGQLREQAVKFMRDDPAKTAQVSAIRVGRVFNVFRPFQQVHLETERGSSVWVMRAGLFAYWLLLPFATVGVIIARRRKVPVYPLLAFPLIVVLSVLPTIGAVRYRAPAEIVLVLLAAVTIDRLVVANRRHRRAERTDAGNPEAPSPACAR